MKMFFLLSVLVGAPSAFAMGEILFGPEFTFYDCRCSEPSKAGLVHRMKNHLIKGQPDSAKFRLYDYQKFAKFTSPNGWSTMVATDAGVIEVTTSPGTVEHFKRFKDDMQDAIFASAANEGLFPALFQGGGHINIGLSAFDENNLLLRNFIVDLFNHNELFMGIFSYDTANALPWNLMTEDHLKRIAKWIERFDNGEFQNFSGQIRFLESLQSTLSAGPLEPFYYSAWNRGPYREKQFAISMRSVSPSNDGRLELRGFRPQASMDVWIRQIELLRNRLLYLEKIKTPIAIQPLVSIQPIDFNHAKHHLNPPIDAQDALKAFYQYVRESGLEWKDHTDYLWPEWISNGELAKFEESSWFKNASCAIRLAEAG